MLGLLCTREAAQGEAFVLPESSNTITCILVSQTLPPCVVHSHNSLESMDGLCSQAVGFSH